MGSLLHPVGARPTWVYWARRAALVVAAVALVTVGFLLFRQPDAGTVTGTPAPQPSTPVQSSASATPSETPSPTPTGPLACDQTNTDLTLAGYQKVKQDAKQPFRLTLKNTGSQDCVLDLKPATFSLTVTSGTDRIWSTADCAKWLPAKKLTLKPGKVHEFGIEWGVDRSAAGCKLLKDVLRPGTYVAGGSFAETVKARQVFQITKAG